MYKQRNRHGEECMIPFRTGRFYCIDGEWWFAIRRGPDQGPYLNKSDAKQSLIDYINDQFEFEKYLALDRELLNARVS